MKYLDFVFILISINIVMSLFVQIGLAPEAYQITSTEIVDINGNPLDTNSISYKVRLFSTDSTNYYNNAGASDPNQIYLQSGGDFLRGLLWFGEIFSKGIFMVGTTLTSMGVPAEISWFFSMPVYLMYAIAFIQLVSGRTFDSTM